MSATPTTEQLIDDARMSFINGDMSFPYFVLALERAVDVAERRGEPSAPALRRTWGQIEIINALSADRSIGHVEAFEAGTLLMEMLTMARLDSAPGPAP